jgi:hypothetical protein
MINLQVPKGMRTGRSHYRAQMSTSQPRLKRFLRLYCVGLYAALHLSGVGCLPAVAATGEEVFRISGSLERQIVRTNSIQRTDTGVFEVLVSGHTTYINLSSLNPGVRSYSYISDETGSWTITEADADGASERRNDAVARLSARFVPEAETLVPIWLAYGAARFLQETPTNSMEALLDVRHAERASPLMLGADWRQAQSSPYGLEYLRLDGSKVNRIPPTTFEVTSWSDDDLRVPSVFEWTLSLGEGRSTRYIGTVSSQSAQEGLDFTANIPTRTFVFDRRFARHADNRVPSIHYMVTNGILPSRDDVAVGELFATALGAQQEARQVSQLFLLALVAVLAAPILYWLYCRSRVRGLNGYASRK